MLILIALLCVLSPVHLFATLWTVAHQAPVSMEFFRQEYWSHLPFPPLRDLPDPGINAASPVFPCIVGRFFATGEALDFNYEASLTRSILTFIKCFLKVF